jgi:hypothetical protein
MGIGFNIPNAVRSKYIGKGARYTMDRSVRYTMGKWVKLPWVGGRYTMDRGFKIPWIGGSIYHGYADRYTMGRG